MIHAESAIDRRPHYRWWKIGEIWSLSSSWESADRFGHRNSLTCGVSRSNPFNHNVVEGSGHSTWCPKLSFELHNAEFT